MHSQYTIYPLSINCNSIADICIRLGAVHVRVDCGRGASRHACIWRQLQAAARSITMKLIMKWWLNETYVVFDQHIEFQHCILGMASLCFCCYSSLIDGEPLQNWTNSS